MPVPLTEDQTDVDAKDDETDDVTFNQEEQERTVNQNEETNEIANYKAPIFNPVPLSERISSGVESFYETILKQRALAREAAALS